jgi:intracellular sulfur oxidation DsrE/DsrF family protein
MTEKTSWLARRFFLSRMGTGMTVLGATAAAGVVAAAPQATDRPAFKPERHTQDDWLDQIPGKHRLVFDTTETDGFGSALTFATNYYNANNSGYGLQNADLAVVVIARHFSTAYAYNDSIWMKYGVPISNFVARGKEPSMRNVNNNQLTTLTGRGLHLAVCQLATRAIAGSIARSAGASQDDIYNELAANLMPNSHLVPAGIVAVNRAQERGYTLVHGG